MKRPETSQGRNVSSGELSIGDRGPRSSLVVGGPMDETAVEDADQLVGQLAPRALAGVRPSIVGIEVGARTR